MDTSFFCSTALLISILGTIFLGISALIFRSPFAIRVIQMLMSVTAFFAALAAIVFLLGDLTPVSAFLLGVPVQIDTLSAIFLLIIGVAAPMCQMYSISYLRNNSHYHIPSLLLCTALFVGGMEMVLVMTTPFSFFFAWEIMSVSSFFLILADREKPSIKAAMQYMTMTQVGAMAIILGLFTAGFQLFENFSVLVPVASLLIPFCFFFLGFGSKAGLVPLHLWLPAAHPQAPSHISALLSGVMLKMAVYAFLRFFFVLHPDLPPFFGAMVLFFGLFSAFFGVLHAST
ncbi:MAG: proton-conducting transporter membrane subunit [Candidatus Peregrinibacteria bacterium]